MSVTRRDFFDTLAGEVCRTPEGVDRVTLYLSAEESDFIRFNHAAVRQATHVRQAHATIALVQGAKRIESTLAISGQAAGDAQLLLEERDNLRKLLPDVPDDPYLLLPEDISSSSRHETGSLPTPMAVVDAVSRAGQALDLVGFYAGGPVVRAFADSRGQRHWHHVESFHFDWCLYHRADKALKTAYAGTHWDEAEFERRVRAGAKKLPLLAQEPRKLEPGEYRAYFTPAAMAELLGTLGWGGFGGQARQTGTSSLSRLEHRDAQLSSGVRLTEDTAGGMAPAFTAEGFAKPAQVSLVEGGRATGTLNSPRSARQYGLPENGANADETPEALSLAAGSLPEDEVLAGLGTGIYVSNLWYLNYSDRQACRMTGMTRFACFWVEDGELVAPLAVMRFDDSFFRMFGDGLMALGDKAELIPDSDTYGKRMVKSITTPGALVEGWRLTL